MLVITIPTLARKTINDLADLGAALPSAENTFVTGCG